MADFAFVLPVEGGEMDSMIIKSSISKIIALILAASVLAGCAESIKNSGGFPIPRSGRQGTPEQVPRSGGLSTPEQVGIGIGAAIAAIALGKVIYDAVNENEAEEQAEKDWLTKGPALAAQFTLNDLTINGYVKGGWPIAVDYQLDRPGSIVLTVGSDKVDPFSIAMNGSTPGRRLQIFHLPDEFGSSPQTAKIRVHATDKFADTEIPLPIKIFGIACGPNAVGSIGIDQISFGPSSVQLNLQQQANYFFFSHKSFDKVSAAFRKVEDRSGVIGISSIVKEETIDMPAIDESVGRWIGTQDTPRVWNGKTNNNQPSQGFHVLQVRAWFGDTNKRDWGVALSPDWVEVKQ
jgi:hypothetical protein